MSDVDVENVLNVRMGNNMLFTHIYRRVSQKQVLKLTSHILGLIKAQKFQYLDLEKNTKKSDTKYSFSFMKLGKSAFLSQSLMGSLLDVEKKSQDSSEPEPFEKFMDFIYKANNLICSIMCQEVFPDEEYDIIKAIESQTDIDKFKSAITVHDELCQLFELLCIGRVLRPFMKKVCAIDESNYETNCSSENEDSKSSFSYLNVDVSRLSREEKLKLYQTEKQILYLRRDILNLMNDWWSAGLVYLHQNFEMLNFISKLRSDKFDSKAKVNEMQKLGDQIKHFQKDKYMKNFGSNKDRVLKVTNLGSKVEEAGTVTLEDRELNHAMRKIFERMEMIKKLNLGRTSIMNKAFASFDVFKTI